MLNLFDDNMLAVREDSTALRKGQSRAGELMFTGRVEGADVVANRVGGAIVTDAPAADARGGAVTPTTGKVVVAPSHNGTQLPDSGETRTKAGKEIALKAKDKTSALAGKKGGATDLVIKGEGPQRALGASDLFVPSLATSATFPKEVGLSPSTQRTGRWASRKPQGDGDGASRLGDLVTDRLTTGVIDEVGEEAGDAGTDSLPSLVRDMGAVYATTKTATAVLKAPGDIAQGHIDKVDGRGRRLTGLRVKNDAKIRAAEAELRTLRAKGVSERTLRYRAQSAKLRYRRMRDRRLGKKLSKHVVRATKPASRARYAAAKAAASKFGRIALAIALPFALLLAVPTIALIVAGGAAGTNTNTGAGALTGDVAELAMFLKSEMGLNDAQAAGILGNVVFETGNGSDHLENWPDGTPLVMSYEVEYVDNSHGYERGIGFVQFTDGSSDNEATALENFARARNKEWTNPEAQRQFFKEVSWEDHWITQSSRAWADANGFAGTKYDNVMCGKQQFLETTEPEMAALIFQCGYLRGFQGLVYGHPIHIKGRMACARYIYKQLTTPGKSLSYGSANAPENVKQFVSKALATIGSGYSWSGYHWTGSPSTSWFTCSGVPCYALGLPSRAKAPINFYHELLDRGVFKNGSSNLNYGDLVIYDYLGTNGIWPAHIGIYLGDGKVLDSIPGSGVQIRNVDYMRVLGGGPAF